MVILSHDGQLFHIITRLLERLHRRLRFDVRPKDGYGYGMRPLGSEPLARDFGLLRIEISNLGGRKWLAKSAHTLLPAACADDRKALDIAKMFQVDLQILPTRTRSPALEVINSISTPNFPCCFMSRSMSGAKWA